MLLPLAFLDVLWKPWQQHRRCPSKWLDVTFQKQKSRWQKKTTTKKPLWAPKVRRKKGNKGESVPVTVRTLFFFLTLCSCVCLTSCSYGQLRGGRTLPVGVSGRGRRCPGATHSQLPPAASHLVQGRAQDSTQQSNVSAFIYSFSFPACRGVFTFIFVFDHVNTFLRLCLFPGLFEGRFSLRALSVLPPVVRHSSRYISC